MTATEARKELKAGNVLRITDVRSQGHLVKLYKRRNSEGFDVFTSQRKGVWEAVVPLESFLYRYGSYTFEKVEGAT